MDKGVVEVEVDAMVVELEDSSRILDLEAPVEGELELMLMLLVMLGVGCTPTKECSDVVDLAPSTAGMPGRRRKVSGKRCVTNSQIEEDSGVKTSKKCECPVQIYASVNAENELVVRKVVNEHQNHNPTPSKSRFVAAHRKDEMNCHVKRKLKLGHSAGLKMAQIHNMLARERNGLQGMAINERDIRNELYWEKKLKLKDGDAKAMLEYFEKMTEGNQFFLHISTRQFWSNARHTLGVNHHDQKILLGCALISHETTETFEWVFRMWVHCMRGIAPGGILTNQAAAMRNALRSTMLETRQCWCIWHITKKFSQKLGKCKGYNEFKDELLNAIYDSLSVPEFESSWMAIIDKHGLEDNV
ncbi:Protein FAR-RED IMPAIRED RESPONSE 1 [Bienertia sinuspersici]